MTFRQELRGVHEGEISENAIDEKREKKYNNRWWETFKSSNMSNGKTRRRNAVSEPRKIIPSPQNNLRT